MSTNKLAALGSSAVVVVSVVVGLILAGSPDEQRLKRLDSQRVYGLQTIVRVIDFYSSDEGELPGALAELVDGRRLTRLPTDPVTGIPYEYKISNGTQYELCAMFDRASDDGSQGDFWAHEHGQKCYVFEIQETK